MLTQKKPRLYACERIFSDSSITSPLRKEDGGQEHPLLKRKSLNPLGKITKDFDKMKVTKKQKHKKVKQRKRVKFPFEGSSEGYAFSVSGPIKDTENNENSVEESMPNVASEEDNEMS